MSTTPYSIYMKSNLRVIIYSNVFLSAVMVQNKQRPRRHLAVTNAKASSMTPLGFRSCPLLYFFRRKQSTLIQKGGLKQHGNFTQKQQSCLFLRVSSSAAELFVCPCCGCCAGVRRGARRQCDGHGGHSGEAVSSCTALGLAPPAAAVTVPVRVKLMVSPQRTAPVTHCTGIQCFCPRPSSR